MCVGRRLPQGDRFRAADGGAGPRRACATEGQGFARHRYISTQGAGFRLPIETSLQLRRMFLFSSGGLAMRRLPGRRVQSPASGPSGADGWQPAKAMAPGPRPDGMPAEARFAQDDQAIAMSQHAVKIAEDAVLLLEARKSYRDKNLDIRLHSPASAGRSCLSDDHSCRSEDRLIEQLIENLLENSVRAIRNEAARDADFVSRLKTWEDCAEDLAKCIGFQIGTIRFMMSQESFGSAVTAKVAVRLARFETGRAPPEANLVERISHEGARFERICALERGLIDLALPAIGDETAGFVSLC